VLYVFPILDGLKQGDALLPLFFFFNFSLDYPIRNVEENYSKLELNGKHQLLLYADTVNIFGEKIKTMRRNIEALLEASRSWCRSKQREG
jgi:hypothetical protein